MWDFGLIPIRVKGKELFPFNICEHGRRRMAGDDGR